MTNIISRRDIDFLLYEFLDVEKLCERDYFSEHDKDIFSPMLDTAEQIANDHFVTCAESGDKNMAELIDGKVEMAEGSKAAMDNLCEAGFIAASLDNEYGGLQLPSTVSNACMSFFQAANVGLCGLPMLTIGVANLINVYGDEEQKTNFLPRLLTGHFYGTMCLSEPHAGSALTDIRTKAEKQDDGNYSISGNKMWITGGEHELNDNIVHLVLAKIPGGPAGVKGISLFIVPRYRLNEDGSIGEDNDVALAGLNHKMGQRITPNCLLNFGENKQCTGYLVGEPHRGLEYMFHMMNEARIAVGLAAACCGYAGYLYSLDYARERTQGRAPDNKDPNNKMIPIIQHSDVKRMLLAQKAYSEGSLALCLYASSLVDDEKTHPDASAREDAHLLLDLLIPVVKAWPSEWCLEANKHAIQILGGYGYTQDYPVERLYRDNRLNMIHEGTNGIHGIDLLGRKVLINDGKGLKLFIAEIDKTIADASNEESLAEYVTSLIESKDIVIKTTEALVAAVAASGSNVFLANSSTYFDMFSNLVIAWLWLKQADVATKSMTNAYEADQSFYHGKIQACQYFFRFDLPKIKTQAELLCSLDTTCLDMPEEAFAC
ncbi:MAG: acyl-CoA dehydrogenase [Gammaproteobacteria bacterium]|nr:acyl-CoA dehydrogenase [Gammaproteobacteria bacterium]